MKHRIPLDADPWALDLPNEEPQEEPDEECPV